MPTPPDWTPSSNHEPSSVPTLVGRYRILFPIAAGGMGTVYAARVESSLGVGRTVALKILKHEAEAANLLPAFFDEARITTRLDHPNVVRTIELGQHGSTTFLAMDFVRGVSLRDLLKRVQNSGERLEPALAAWIVARAAAGLHSAHELATPEGILLGLVHRDISPDNILVAYDGSVRVTDFGIAKLSTSEQTREGVIKGKFAYMSPEQVAGEALDRRSDLFSLGVVFWEALACRRLFKGKTPRDTVAQILSGKVQRPDSDGAVIPAAFVDIAMKCLSPKPEQRPATASELEQLLRSAIRASAGRPDDTDVAELVCRVFEKEKRELEQRLAGAERSGPLSIALESPPDVSVSAAGISLESKGHARHSRSRYVLLGVALFIMVGVGGWVLASRDAPHLLVAAPPMRQVEWSALPGASSAPSVPSAFPSVSASNSASAPPLYPRAPRKSEPRKGEPKKGEPKKGDPMFEKL